MFCFILVVTALSVFVGGDDHPLSILFVLQHKTAPSTCPQDRCLRPLTSQSLSATCPLFFLFPILLDLGGRRGLGEWSIQDAKPEALSRGTG